MPAFLRSGGKLGWGKQQGGLPLERRLRPGSEAPRAGGSWTASQIPAAVPSPRLLLIRQTEKSEAEASLLSLSSDAGKNPQSMWSLNTNLRSRGNQLHINMSSRPLSGRKATGRLQSESHACVSQSQSIRTSVGQPCILTSRCRGTEVLRGLSSHVTWECLERCRSAQLDSESTCQHHLPPEWPLSLLGAF